MTSVVNYDNSDVLQSTFQYIYAGSDDQYVQVETYDTVPNRIMYITYEYVAGKITKDNLYLNDATYVSYTIYSYIVDNMTQTDSYSVFTGTRQNYTIYTYSGSTLIKTEAFDDVGTRQSYIIYTYSGSTLIKIETFDDVGTRQNYTIYTYSGSTLIKTETFDDAGTRQNYNIYSYETY